MDFLSFLLPFHLSPLKVDALPSAFFVVIWGAFFYTIFQVYKYAKPENWDRNWSNGTDEDTSDDLDAEHGSVIELSSAVATPAEKMADIMPGMILIIGLLGTFLGLGLALDKASGILTSANALSNMDSSMTQLMGMLEGLGTKFKTSTWGLLAFILLKVILSKNGYEERRLRWAIEKVKKELDFVRDKKQQEEQANNQKLIDCMQSIAQRFEQVAQTNQEYYKSQQQHILKHNQDVVSAIQLSHQEHSKLLGAIQQNQTDHTKAFKYQALSFEKLLVGLSKQYDQMIKAVEQQHQENKNFLKDLVKQGRDTRDAMVGFIEKNEATVTTLGKSAAGMSNAASTMGDSAKHLQGVINSFRDNMEQVVSLMKEDLNTTISGMNTSFSQNMTKMSDNLKNSIGDMSTSFKKNMSEMSQGLGTATQDISSAVNSLSASVDETMTQVTNTIGQSMDLQTKAQTVFVQSTDTLNEYINEMTGLVNKLSGDITGGLKAVSTSNREMINLAKQTIALTEVVDGTFKESLQSITSVTTLKPALESLTVGLDSQIALLKQISENTENSVAKKQKGNGIIPSFGGGRK